MVKKLFVPSLETPPVGVQLVVVKSEFCCKVQPAEGYGQEILRLLPESAMANWGDGTGVAGDWLGLARRPMKRMLPDWVSWMRKMNG